MQWWRRYAERVRRPPEDVAEIMRVAAMTPNPYPHIRLRLVLDRSEAYLPGTGLAVWEIAWIAGFYDRDIDATMAHLGQSREVVEEGLRYADEHAAEIEAEIKDHTADTLEELQEKLPGIRVMPFDIGESDEQLR